MAAKTETNFWKSVKKLLENGKEKYLVSRIESYATPGFPDCIVFHRDTGFFTIELKIMQPNGRIRISPLQSAWNKWWGGSGAPVFILVDFPTAPKGRWVKLFPGRLAQELREKTIDAVPGLYEGRLTDLNLVKLLNSQTP